MIPHSTIEVGLEERYNAHRHDIRYVQVGGDFADLQCANCRQTVTVQHIPHGGWKVYPSVEALDNQCTGAG